MAQSLPNLTQSPVQAHSSSSKPGRAATSPLLGLGVSFKMYVLGQRGQSPSRCLDSLSRETLGVANEALALAPPRCTGCCWVGSGCCGVGPAVGSGCCGAGCNCCGVDCTCCAVGSGCCVVGSSCCDVDRGCCAYRYTVRRHVPAATMRVPQQHDECMDGCVSRATCTCGVFIDESCGKPSFVGKLYGTDWTFFFRG